MVRRDVVAQPSIAVGIAVRRLAFAFVDRRLWQLIAEDFINCVA